MTETATTTEQAPAPAAAPAQPTNAPDWNAIGAELDLSAAEAQTEVTAILAESYMASVPEDQKLELALGVMRSRQMEALGDLGKPFEIHILSVVAPTTITPKGKDPFTVGNVLAVGFPKLPDGSDGPVGIVEVAHFVRDGMPPKLANVWQNFEVGKSYGVDLKWDDSVPVEGQIPIYKVTTAGNTDPSEIPVVEGIDYKDFVLKWYNKVEVPDAINHTTTDWDDRSTWVAFEASIISARAGVSKKGNDYGFYEVVPVGTNPKDLQSNPNLSLSIQAGKEGVMYATGSRVWFVGATVPENGDYAASFRPKYQIPVLGIPYRVQATTTEAGTSIPGAASGATDDPADVNDF